MKKFITMMAVMAATIVSCFAITTANIGAKTNDNNVFATVGIDIKAHSFESSELWIEPHLNIGTTNDNNESFLAYGVGLSITECLLPSGFFVGLNGDYIRSSFDDGSQMNGINGSVLVGMKWNYFKFGASLDKGWYKIDGGDDRYDGTKSPFGVGLFLELVY